MVKRKDGVFGSLFGGVVSLADAAHGHALTTHQSILRGGQRGADALRAAPGRRGAFQLMSAIGRAELASTRSAGNAGLRRVRTSRFGMEPPQQGQGYWGVCD